ncbi:MAG TPA: glycine oxidase ThiO [Solirubrobacteraceae bacterium]|nr:glycine oxidase ThiO [Solirubrobacteraceae bacterium]
MDRREVIIVGGGVIGLSIAWNAARSGIGVTLLERERFGAGATHAAAGMLAPVAEADFGDSGRALLDLGLSSAASWPLFAAELESASGLPSRLRADGTLVLARDRDEAEALERQLAYRQRLGLAVARITASRARELEPALAPSLRLALEIPGESSVDPRWVCDALVLAARGAGAELREWSEVAGLVRRGGRVSGVTLADGVELSADQVVLAAGAWSGALSGVPVRPVKGQIIRLRDGEGPGLLNRTLRFEGGYVVTRGDGSYVLGASSEERGFDTTVTARPIFDLLRDASELVPGLLDLEIEEITVGLRPGTPDNLPLIGASDEAGLILACGHFRSGILLAPLTAMLVLRALEGATAPASAQARRRVVDEVGV